MILNVIIFAFGIFLLLYFYYGLKKGDFTINEFLFWSFFSIIIMFFSFNIKLLKSIVSFLQFYRILDFVTVFGFMFFIIAILYLYKQNRRLEKRFNELVIRLALENKKKKIQK